MHKYEKPEASTLWCILLTKVQRVNFNLRSSPSVYVCVHVCVRVCACVCMYCVSRTVNNCRVCE